MVDSEAIRERYAVVGQRLNERSRRLFAAAEAQTVASMNQARGQIGTMFRASEQLKVMLADPRRAQAEAEAEIRCF